MLLNKPLKIMDDKCKASDSICSLRRSKFEECDQTEITLRKVANVITSPCQIKIYNSTFLVTDSEREDINSTLSESSSFVSIKQKDLQPNIKYKRKKKTKRKIKIKTFTAPNKTTYNLTESQMDNITKINNGSSSYNSPLKCVTPSLEVSFKHSFMNKKNEGKNKRTFCNSNPKPLKKRKREEMNTTVVQEEQSIQYNDKLVEENIISDEQTVDHDGSDIEDNQLSAWPNFSGRKEKFIKTHKGIENQFYVDNVEGKSAEAVTKQTNNMLNDEERTLKYTNKCLSGNVLTARDATSKVSIGNDESVHEDSYNQNSLLPSSNNRNDVETTINVTKKIFIDNIGNKIRFDESSNKISRKTNREKISSIKKRTKQPITSIDLLNISNKTEDCLKAHKKCKEEKLITTKVQDEQSIQSNDKLVEEEIVSIEQIIDLDDTDIENDICPGSGDQLSLQPKINGAKEELMKTHKGVESQSYIGNVGGESIKSCTKQGNKVFCSEENSLKHTNKYLSENVLTACDDTSEVTIGNYESTGEDSYNQNSLLPSSNNRNDVGTTLNVMKKNVIDNNVGNTNNVDESPKKISRKTNREKITGMKKRTKQSITSKELFNISNKAGDCLKAHKKRKEEKLNTTEVQDEQSIQSNDKLVEEKIVSIEQIIDLNDTDIENDICLDSGDQLSVQSKINGAKEELMKTHKGVENQSYIDNVVGESIKSCTKKANKVFCSEENSMKHTNKCLSENVLTACNDTSEVTIGNYESTGEDSYNQNSLLPSYNNRNDVGTTVNVMKKNVIDNNVGNTNNVDESPKKISRNTNREKITGIKKRTKQSITSKELFNISNKTGDCLKAHKKRKVEKLNTTEVQDEQSIQSNDKLVEEEIVSIEQIIDLNDTDIENDICLYSGDQLSVQSKINGAKEELMKTHKGVENQSYIDNVVGESIKSCTKKANKVFCSEENSMKHTNKCLSENVLTACDDTSEVTIGNYESTGEDSYNQNSLLPSTNNRNDVGTTLNVMKKNVIDNNVGNTNNVDESPKKISRKTNREKITGMKKRTKQSITSKELFNISNKTGDCLKAHKKRKEEKLNTTEVQDEQSIQSNDKLVEEEIVSNKQIEDLDETDIENDICLGGGDQLSVQPKINGAKEELMKTHKGVDSQSYIGNVGGESIKSCTKQGNKVFCNEENSLKSTYKCISEDILSVQDANSELTVEYYDLSVEEDSYNLDLDNQNSLLQTTSSRNSIETAKNLKIKNTTDNNIGSESNYDELPEKISCKVNKTKISGSKERTIQSITSVDCVNINDETSDSLQCTNSRENYENNVNYKSQFLNQSDSSLDSDDTPNKNNKTFSKKERRSCSPVTEKQFKDKLKFKLNKRKVGSKSEKQLRNVCKSKNHNYSNSFRSENEDESLESAYLSQSSLDSENGKDNHSSQLNTNAKPQFKVWSSTPRIPETLRSKAKINVGNSKIHVGESSNNGRKHVDGTFGNSTSYIREESTSQSVLEEVMENIQLHVIVSEEELKRLKKLNIKITWELSKIHAVDNGSQHMSLKKLKTILGPDSDLLCDGKFTSQEVKQIKRNWKKFCKIYGFKNPEMFMSSKQLYGYFPIKERLKFKQFLARKLPYRRLYSVYHKFMDIFAVKSRGRWTEKEDQLLLQLYHAYDEEEENVKYGISRHSLLTKALQRTPMSVHRRLQVLLGDDDKEEKDMPGDIGWTPDLEGKVVYYLLKKLNYDSIEELRYATIPDEVWHNVADKLALSHRQLINHWKYFLYPQLFARQAMLRDHLYIELICWFKKSKIQDWADVNWEDLSKRAGDLGRFYLYRCYRALTRNYVPKDLHTNFRACTIHMYKYLLPSLLQKEHSYMLKRWRYNPHTRSLEKLEDDDADCSFKIE